MVGTLLATNLTTVQSRITSACAKAGRNPQDVRLIAVTKTHPAQLVREAHSLGLTEFGESYVQEAQLKKQELQSLALTWHFIGRLQTNKVKSVVGEYALIHSVGSLRLAEQIAARAQVISVNQDILLQVNIGGEESKGGFSLEELFTSAPLVFSLPNLRVRGLMTIPAPAENETQAADHFRELRQCLERLKLIERDQSQHPLTELSMGMSSDFEIAIAEGATMIRLGTVLFGSRAV